jgi:hypothetical protein
MAAGDSCSLLSSAFGLPIARSPTTSEAVMRDEARVLLAAAASIMFSVASVARAKPDLQQGPENTLPESGMFRTALYGPSFRSLASSKFAENPTVMAQGRSTAAPHMIIWSVCGAPRSGSALSMYSLQGSAMRQDVPSHQCADDDEGEPDEDSTTVARFTGPKGAGSALGPL